MAIKHSVLMIFYLCSLNDSINVFDCRVSCVMLDSYIVYLDQGILIGVMAGKIH